MSGTGDPLIEVLNRIHAALERLVTAEETRNDFIIAEGQARAAEWVELRDDQRAQLQAMLIQPLQPTEPARDDPRGG
jgi:hypothetical protein